MPRVFGRLDNQRTFELQHQQAFFIGNLKSVQYRLSSPNQDLTFIA